MFRSPRATLTSAVKHPRSLDLAALIVVISAACSAGFLMTRVGQLAALDQQVRQLESFGVAITDDAYEQLRRVVPYRPVVSAALIVIGWPILWLSSAGVVHWFGRRAGRGEATFPQVLTVVVHASAILAGARLHLRADQLRARIVGRGDEPRQRPAGIWRFDIFRAPARRRGYLHRMVGGAHCAWIEHSVSDAHAADCAMAVWRIRGRRRCACVDPGFTRRRLVVPKQEDHRRRAGSRPHRFGRRIRVVVATLHGARRHGRGHPCARSRGRCVGIGQDPAETVRQHQR